MLQNPSEGNTIDYKHKCALALVETQQTHRNSWDTYISRFGDDIHERQRHAYKILKRLNKDEKGTAQLNVITEKAWFEYYRLSQSDKNASEQTDCKYLTKAVDPLTMEELNLALEFSGNKKPPSMITTMWNYLNTTETSGTPFL